MSDIDKVKPHSHPGILAVSLLALAVAIVSLFINACPPVPVPAAVPAKVDPQPDSATQAPTVDSVVEVKLP